MTQQSKASLKISYVVMFGVLCITGIIFVSKLKHVAEDSRKYKGCIAVTMERTGKTAMRGEKLYHIEHEIIKTWDCNGTLENEIVWMRSPESLKDKP